MANMITGIISITIGAVMLAGVFISSIKGTNQTGTGFNASPHGHNCAVFDNCTARGAWTASEIAMWSLLTLVGVVGLLYGVLAVFGLA